MSTLTVELDSLTESRLQERSLQEGRNKEDLAAHLLARAARSDRFLTPQEIEWLRLAREELSDAHWKRYRKLGRKSKTGTLSPEEYAELLELGSQIEAHHVKRLEAVWKLSQRWGCGFEETMKLLGVGPRRA